MLIISKTPLQNIQIIFEHISGHHGPAKLTPKLTITEVYSSPLGYSRSCLFFFFFFLLRLLTTMVLDKASLVCSAAPMWKKTGDFIARHKLSLLLDSQPFLSTLPRSEQRSVIPTVSLASNSPLSPD